MKERKLSGRMVEKSKQHRYTNNDEEGRSNSQAEALSALEAHFAAQFDLPSMKRSDVALKGKGKEKVLDADKKAEDYQPSKLDSIESKKRSIVLPQTVVFGESSKGGEGAGSIEGSSGWKRFMSSKVTTRTDLERQALQTMRKGKASTTDRTIPEGGVNDDEEDEKQAQSNDRELSELLGTTLFAPGGIGTKTTRSNGRPILGSNDTLARLLELSKHSITGKAQSQGRGLGEAMVKSQEMSKMPANIRHGMRRVEMERQDRDLKRQKELGNYHHSIKGFLNKKEGLDLVLGTKDKDRAKRKRDKGIGMGIGKFQGGMLKLSEREVERINRPSNQSRSKRRKT